MFQPIAEIPLGKQACDSVQCVALPPRNHNALFSNRELGTYWHRLPVNNHHDRHVQSFVGACVAPLPNRTSLAMPTNTPSAWKHIGVM
jgi:hypothetical protein